ncbi:MAG TPA: hypothetical protein PKA06_00575, partial [Gemmatales bacterium]|nr:hypothetical protein [Gemmatales bacterium]
MPLSKSSAYSIIVLFILVLVGFCVYSRQEVLARYHAWRLQSAPMDALDRYVLRFEQLTEPGMRAVVRLLHHSDPTVCTKASLTLTKLFPLWNDSDQHNCLQYIREQAVNFSSAGQQACLQLLHGFCETPSGSHQACQIMQSIMMASCQGSEHKQALLEFMNTLLLQENSAQHPQHNE